MAIPAVKDLLGPDYDPALTYSFITPAMMSERVREGWSHVLDYETETPTGPLVLISRPNQPGDHPPVHRFPEDQEIVKLGAKQPVAGEGE